MAVMGTVLTTPSDQYSQPSYDVSIGACIQVVAFVEWFDSRIIYIINYVYSSKAKYIYGTNKYTQPKKTKQNRIWT